MQSAHACLEPGPEIHILCWAQPESCLGEDLLVFWTDYATSSKEPLEKELVKVRVPLDSDEPESCNRGARVLKTYERRSTRVHPAWSPCLASCASWPPTGVTHMVLRDLGQLYGVSLMDDLQELHDQQQVSLPESVDISEAVSLFSMTGLSHLWYSRFLGPSPTQLSKV